MTFDKEGKTDRQIIEEGIPHRSPFLFLEKILDWDENGIQCSYCFKEDEFFFKGHYPDSPLVPGVILCESAMQAGALYLSRCFKRAEGDGKKVPVVGRMTDIKFKQIVRPGNEVVLFVKLKEKMGNIWYLTAKVTLLGKTVVTFEFACTETDRV